MKKNFLLMTLLLTMCIMGKAQIGINQNSPMANLDIKASVTPTFAEGLLIPKVSVSLLDAMSSRYNQDLDGVLVNVTQITNSTDSKTIDIKNVGFYYYDQPQSKWKRTDVNLGNGSFTPNIIKMAVSKNTKWSNYVNYNYFEFYEDGSFNSTINMPAPNVFANKTIYLRNNAGGNLMLDCTDKTDFPDTINPDNSVTQNIGLGGLLSYSLYGSSAIQAYSDGNRWYLMSGQKTF
ncbi:hypothetical protein [Apibacter adventoris]|uniref:Uncharacterized protein n=1 Tax=Apibacter adventoris TaxID=1679466 RepID=A0A2S8AFH6_9FLAO|nr:hypothetical protein [Apibacter adventoris]PQL94890.1 hypothetical protein C4S77_02600 [Apibacter adventoris]